jgi:hypothetical protein
MKTIATAGLVAVALMAVLAGSACGAEEEEKMSFWMKKKLAYTEGILVGLTSEDFEAIGKNARSMNALGYFEKWVRAGSAEYSSQLKIFKNANERLIRMADEENLDGAALAYVQLTLSCVNCHKVVRDRGEAKPSK